MSLPFVRRTPLPATAIPMRCPRPSCQDVFWTNVGSRHPDCFVCRQPGIRNQVNPETPRSPYVYHASDHG